MIERVIEIQRHSDYGSRHSGHPFSEVYARAVIKFSNYD